MNSRICFVKFEDNLLFDDFIYNRFDKQLVDGEIGVISIGFGSERKYVQYLVDGETIKLGVWLIDIDKKTLLKIKKSLFKKYKQVKQIEMPFISCPIGYCVKKNHYILPLPDAESFGAMIKKKHYRESFKREKELIDLLGEKKMVIYNANECPNSILDFYFDCKKNKMNVDYKMSGSSYLISYHVTNVYALFYGNQLVSVLLSCEQCSNVYLENIAYNNLYSRYSPGKLLYIYFVETMISSHKKTIYLGGGDYEYKKYFGSNCEEKYIAIAYRNRGRELFYCLKSKIKRVLKK